MIHVDMCLPLNAFPRSAATHDCGIQLGDDALPYMSVAMATGKL